MTLYEIRTKKLCFVYCGENCNCETGMDWQLSEDAKAKMKAIDDHIATAAHRLDRSKLRVIWKLRGGYLSLSHWGLHPAEEWMLS